ILDSRTYREISKLHDEDPKARWLLYENASCAQLVKTTGAIIFNGVKILPDLDFMHELDPSNNYTWIYNRFAYINVSLPQAADEIRFALNAPNNYEFTVPPEHPALRRRGYRYLIFPRPWLNAELHGYALREAIEPSELYVYRLQTSTAE